MTVLLIYGGASPEHEVSVRSATTVKTGLESAGHHVLLAHVTRDGAWKLVPGIDASEGPGIHHTQEGWKASDKTLVIDVAFPMIHGVTGEDGQLQTFLEATRTSYVGCSAAVSRHCFDKDETKRSLSSAGIMVTPDVVLHESMPLPTYDAMRSRLGGVLFVKPARSGSSIGVHRVTDSISLNKALVDAFTYDNKILIEAAIQEPQELEVAVLEQTDGQLVASGVGEVLPGEEFYSYDDKYAENSAAQTTTNPLLAQELSEQVCKLALKTAKTLGCRGMVRVDLLYSRTQKILNVNEVNTLPGFTSISMYPKLWEAQDMSLSSLCDTLVRVAAK